ncbi:hypothetical protein LTS15_007388 [Exophiala xenobiotica]|nr:hypothetical protein LTS15_007388 [Exophiala xenobiotica]
MVTNVINGRMFTTPGLPPPANGEEYNHTEAMEFLQTISPEKAPPVDAGSLMELIRRLNAIAESLDSETQNLARTISTVTIGLPEVQSSTLLRTLMSLPAQWILRAHPRTTHNSKGIHLFYFPDLHDYTERVRELFMQHRSGPGLVGEGFSPLCGAGYQLRPQQARKNSKQELGHTGDVSRSCTSLREKRTNSFVIHTFNRLTDEHRMRTKDEEAYFNSKRAEIRTHIFKSFKDDTSTCNTEQAARLDARVWVRDVKLTICKHASAM